MKRSALVGAIIGAVIPISFWILFACFGYMAGSEMVVLRPSSIALMGLETVHSAAIAIGLWIAAALPTSRS
ncbi:hypothetical protein, partial [Undibacterium sp.]|uniref:hypothetical protein n=1 Tax=Undibacterium sp. TaxID=1914977 RepID=UPI002BEFE784